MEREGVAGNSALFEQRAVGLAPCGQGGQLVGPQPGGVVEEGCCPHTLWAILGAAGIFMKEPQGSCLQQRCQEPGIPLPRAPREARVNAQRERSALVSLARAASRWVSGNPRPRLKRSKSIAPPGTAAAADSGFSHRPLGANDKTVELKEARSEELAF